MGTFQESADGGSRLVTVSGYSGVGKSALVQELQKPVLAANGNYISGKFDQYKRNIPYLPIIGAFQELTRKLLTKSSEELTVWSERIRSALGGNGQVLVSVMPEIELIIGKQNPVPELPAAETQNRFNLTIQAFLKAVATKEHPLAMFLDDLQWADVPSLKLLEAMMHDPDIRNFLLICAYRDNEVDDSHPLITSLREMEKGGVKKIVLNLRPLGVPAVTDLICDAFRLDEDSAAPLAEVCVRKTDGNPFFLSQFLRKLYEDGLVHFDQTGSRWRFDASEIEKRDISDNVVELMAQKISSLNIEGREALKFAACVGNTFDAHMMAVVSGRSEEEITSAISQPVREGLVVPLAESGVEETGRSGIETYRFLHDRVQQAADTLLTDKERTDIHVGAGWQLLKNTENGGRENFIFDIANHLNHGTAVVNERNDRITIAGLNFEAGKKAKGSAAFESAYRHMKTGIDWLGNEWSEDCRQLHYDLTISAADTACFLGDFTASDAYVEKALANSKSPLEECRAYEVLILSNIARKRLVEAVSFALKGIKSLGLTLPENPNTSHILSGVLKVKLAQFGKNDNDILSLPPLTAPDKLMILRLVSKASIAAFFTNQNLFVLFAIQTTLITLRYGLSIASAYSFSIFGHVLLSALGDIEGGYRFGRLAVRLEEQKDLKEFRGKALTMYYAVIHHWKWHYKDGVARLNDVYQINRDAGDFEFACYAILNGKIGGQFWAGTRLDHVLSETDVQIKLVRQMKMDGSLTNALMYTQVMTNLHETGNGDPMVLSGPVYTETEEEIKKWVDTKNLSTLGEFSILKLFLCVIFGDFQRALKHTETVALCAGSIAGQLDTNAIYYLDSITRLALWDGSTPAERKATLKKTKQNQKKLAKWAGHSPTIHKHKWHLVEAERARVLGRTADAEEHYKNAIRLAIENDWAQDEALANERAGEFFLSRGLESAATGYFIEARACYARWGAGAKVAQMEKQRPALRPVSIEKFKEKAGSTPSRESTTADGSSAFFTSTSDDETFGNLDFHSALKAARALSGEIQLPRLLERLLRIVFETAGAQRGVLILDGPGGLAVEGDGRMVGSKELIAVLQSTPLNGHSGISLSAVNFVMRTGETLVVNDASADEKYGNDPYVRSAGVRSMLCMPMAQKGATAGCLYLENNLTAGAFTEGRIGVLNIIMAQLAVAIENARLYESVEKKVAERTAELLSAKETAENATRLKDKFVELVSHDIRSPIAGLGLALKGFAKSKYLVESDRLFVEKIIFHNKNILDMVNRLLDVTRLRTGKISLAKRLVPVKTLADECLSSFEHLAEVKKIKLGNFIPTETTVMADPDLLSECISNLLSNAVKFTNPGGEVRIFADPENSAAIAVSDTGVGVPSELVDDLFNAEIKTTEVGTDGEKGTGLGLPYCKDIMEAHGGRIIVKSEVGRGSVFYLQLPPRTTFGKGSPAGRQQLFGLKTMTRDAKADATTIFMADDHAIFLDGLRRILSEKRFKIVGESSNGCDALKMILELKPTIALLDISMPKCSGIDVARELLKKKVGTKVILLTALDDQKYLDEAVKLDVGGYILKDNSANELIDAINYVLDDSVWISPILSARILKKVAASAGTPGYERLTTTEKEILSLLSKSKTSAEIAVALHCSPKTIKNHRANICVKLNLKGQNALLKFALQQKNIA